MVGLGLQRGGQIGEKFSAQMVQRPNALEIDEMTSKRILVVDDEPSIREVVALCLERLGGWVVLSASSGQDALLQARAEQPDAIVLDVMMPEMDGFTFLKHLREDPATQPIPVVLLTANSYLPNAQMFSKLGIVLTVEKPFQPYDLIQQISRAMGW